MFPVPGSDQEIEPEAEKLIQLNKFTASEDPSLGGTYRGVAQMGLLWSLRPAPGSKPGLR